MIVYYNTKKDFNKNDSISIKAFSKLHGGQENAKDEIKLDFEDPEFKTYALAIKCKVFNPLCVDHVHQLLQAKPDARIEKLQDTLNNTSQIFKKKGGIHQTLIKLGFRACLYFEDNQQHIFTLAELEMKVLRIDTFSWYQTTRPSKPVNSRPELN